MKRRFQFISVRIIAILIGTALLGLGAALDFFPPAVFAAGIVLLAAAGWFWSIRPYCFIEKSISNLLDGYTPSDAELAENRALSPSTGRLYEKFREVLSPTQLFNMNKSQARYLALQNQINPHFLYNTLESIRSEAMLAGLDGVANMTESLATFFRYTITKVENLVSVEEELQNCETYFNIQKYRFGDRLVLDIKCNEEDRDAIFRCRLPKLTMQPILENSIIHGTELKIGTGHLTIYLERTEKNLLIRISDDGLGMGEETLAGINSRLGKDNLNIARQDQDAKGGLALINVDNRIRLLFGDEFGLHVFSILGAGTDVEIILPAITSDRDIKNREVLR